MTSSSSAVRPLHRRDDNDVSYLGRGRDYGDPFLSFSLVIHLSTAYEYLFEIIPGITTSLIQDQTDQDQWVSESNSPMEEQKSSRGHPPKTSRTFNNRIGNGMEEE